MRTSRPPRTRTARPTKGRCGDDRAPRCAESAEGITVPLGNPDTLKAAGKQLMGVAAQLESSSSQVAGMPSLMSSWAGPGSSNFAELTGHQATSLASTSLNVMMAGTSIEIAADQLEDAQNAARAIARAKKGREEINAAKYDKFDRNNPIWAPALAGTKLDFRKPDLGGAAGLGVDGLDPEERRGVPGRRALHARRLPGVHAVRRGAGRGEQPHRQHVDRQQARQRGGRDQGVRAAGRVHLAPPGGRQDDGARAERPARRGQAHRRATGSARRRTR